MLAILLVLALDAGRSEYLEPLKLELSAAKKTVLVGEPARLVLAWSASRPLEVTKGTVGILLDDGTGFRPWGEAVFGAMSVVELPQRLEPGKVEKTVHVLGASGYIDTSGRGHFSFAFPRVGQYLVRAEYGPKDGGVVSNEVVLRAIKPQGRDADLFERHLREHPELLTPWATVTGDEVLERIFGEYSHSPYLARPRLLFWQRHIEELMTERQREAASIAARRAVDLIEQMAREELDDSPFDEDRLLFVAEMKTRLGKLEEAMEVYRKILGKYPEGYAAATATKRLSRLAGPDGK